MFAVFGKSRVKAEEKAKKDVPVCSSIEEYRDRLKKLTDIKFKKIGVQKISPVYSSRREAEQYLQLANKAGTVEKAIIKIGRDGGESEKTGKKLIKWDVLA